MVSKFELVLKLERGQNDPYESNLSPK